MEKSKIAGTAFVIEDLPLSIRKTLIIVATFKPPDFDIKLQQALTSALKLVDVQKTNVKVRLTDVLAVFSDVPIHSLEEAQTLNKVKQLAVNAVLRAIGDFAYRRCVELQEREACASLNVDSRFEISLQALDLKFYQRALSS